jgi:hypothetical protein
MEAAVTAFDKLRAQTYYPLTLQFEGDTVARAAILTDVRGEGTSDVSLSCRFDNPMYDELAKKLGSKLSIAIGDETYFCRLHAIHPESVNVHALTVRVSE